MYDCTVMRRNWYNWSNLHISSFFQFNCRFIYNTFIIQYLIIIILFTSIEFLDVNLIRNISQYIPFRFIESKCRDFNKLHKFAFGRARVLHVAREIPKWSRTVFPSYLISSIYPSNEYVHSCLWSIKYVSLFIL